MCCRPHTKGPEEKLAAGAGISPWVLLSAVLPASMKPTQVFSVLLFSCLLPLKLDVDHLRRLCGGSVVTPNPPTFPGGV